MEDVVVNTAELQPSNYPRPGVHGECTDLGLRFQESQSLPRMVVAQARISGTTTRSCVKTARQARIGLALPRYPDVAVPTARQG